MIRQVWEVLEIRMSRIFTQSLQVDDHEFAIERLSEEHQEHLPSWNHHTDGLHLETQSELALRLTHTNWLLERFLGMEFSWWMYSHFLEGQPRWLYLFHSPTSYPQQGQSWNHPHQSCWKGLCAFLFKGAIRLDGWHCRATTISVEYPTQYILYCMLCFLLSSCC